nr:hypothetical protein CFP56_61641 [Quercus suber]
MVQLKVLRLLVGVAGFVRSSFFIRVGSFVLRSSFAWVRSSSFGVAGFFFVCLVLRSPGFFFAWVRSSSFGVAGFFFVHLVLRSPGFFFVLLRNPASTATPRRGRYNSILRHTSAPKTEPRHPPSLLCS